MSSVEARPGAGVRACRLAIVHAIAALALVVAGSLVNSHQAALSVPDWPLSYGRLLLLRWSGNTGWEQAHRLAAALIVVLHVALLLALRRLDESKRRRLLRWMTVSTVLLAVQILLGGAVVLALDPPWLGALHVTLAQLFAAASVVLARACAAPVRVYETGLRSLAALPWLLALQIVLGAISRHPVAGQGPFIGTMAGHALLGLVLVGWSVAAGIRLARRGGRRRGIALAALAVAQLGVGLAVFFVAPEPLSESWPPPTAFPTLHAAHHVLAALLLGVALRVPRGR